MCVGVCREGGGVAREDEGKRKGPSFHVNFASDKHCGDLARRSGYNDIFYASIKLLPATNMHRFCKVLLHLFLHFV